MGAILGVAPIAYAFVEDTPDIRDTWVSATERVQAPAHLVRDRNKAAPVAHIDCSYSRRIFFLSKC
jgi:hypothetical protein